MKYLKLSTVFSNCRYSRGQIEGILTSLEFASNHKLGWSSRDTYARETQPHSDFLPMQTYFENETGMNFCHLKKIYSFSKNVDFFLFLYEAAFHIMLVSLELGNELAMCSKFPYDTQLNGL